MSQTAIAIFKTSLVIEDLNITIDTGNLIEQVKPHENQKFKLLGYTGPDVTNICQSITAQYSLVRTNKLNTSFYLNYAEDKAKHELQFELCRKQNIMESV